MARFPLDVGKYGVNQHVGKPFTFSQLQMGSLLELFDMFEFSSLCNVWTRTEFGACSSGLHLFPTVLGGLFVVTIPWCKTSKNMLDCLRGNPLEPLGPEPKVLKPASKCPPKKWLPFFQGHAIGCPRLSPVSGTLAQRGGLVEKS